jgi:hypothetical protein
VIRKRNKVLYTVILYIYIRATNKILKYKCYIYTYKRRFSNDNKNYEQILCFVFLVNQRCFNENTKYYMINNTVFNNAISSICYVLQISILRQLSLNKMFRRWILIFTELLNRCTRVTVYYTTCY